MFFKLLTYYVILDLFRIDSPNYYKFSIGTNILA